MDLQKIKALIDLLAQSPLERLEVIEGEERVKLVKTKRRGKRRHGQRSDEGAVAMAQPFDAPTPAAEAAHAASGDATATAATQSTTAATADAPPQLVRAPMFGIVHLTPSPDEPPFVQVGDTVGEGDVLCTIEAMKMFNAIESDCRGIVREVLVAPGSEVESGQPLFRIG